MHSRRGQSVCSQSSTNTTMTNSLIWTEYFICLAFAGWALACAIGQLMDSAWCSHLATGIVPLLSLMRFLLCLDPSFIDLDFRTRYTPVAWRKKRGKERKMAYVTGTWRDTRLRGYMKGIRIPLMYSRAVFLLHSEGETRHYDCETRRLDLVS
jgi:hypothetical protein